MANPARTKCEIYTRVMWYYRPVSQFNIGKKAEFYSRTYFTDQIDQSPSTTVKKSSLFSQDQQCKSEECKKSHI